MKGRRLDWTEDEDGIKHLPDMEVGDYCGPVVGFTGDLPAVFFRLPFTAEFGYPDGPGEVQGPDGDGGQTWYDLRSGVRHCTHPPHDFHEEDDGSLTITASILEVKPHGVEGPPWHGYLTRGEWVNA